MDIPQENRGRSHSVGNKNRSLNPSPSPHTQYNGHASALNIDPAASTSPFHNPSFASANPVTTANEQYTFAPPYLSDSHPFQNPAPSDVAFNTPQPFANSFEASFISQLEHSSNLKAAQNAQKAQNEDQFTTLLNSNQPGLHDFSLYTNTNPASEFDSSLVLDPQLEHSPQQPVNQSVNPADLSRMSSPHNPTPPHLIPPDAQPSPNRPSSPASTPGAYYTPQQSRPVSLDPASAAFLSSQPQADWQVVLGNPAFQSHRRAPSEHSEVSSAAHSPYLAQHESFDHDSNSPLLSAQTDPGLYENALGMDGFSISDQQQRLISPGHSPYISPHLSPQQQHLELSDNSFLLTQHVSNQLTSGPPDIYTTNAETSPMPNLPQHAMMGDMGQAAQMTPPSINVEFAPPSRTSSFGPPKVDMDTDTLSPPPNRSRGRSKSDPFAHPMTRPMSPGIAPGLGAIVSSSPRSLSPFNPAPRTLSTPSSREVSPAAKHRRQSTSSIENRNYILDLADPQRPGASITDSKRVQKHPATFQCNLCPKRFTRAYNLRSHLRTHTDERPFVCTVCGKAFARQHDRKRHEGLHSGEKKFVCRGDLSRGGNWGCGRRFARADALGRHFRSEAGRVCIKPLLDEEALERERTFMGQQQQLAGHLQPVTQPMTIPAMDGQPTTFTLPAALLQQYPALQTLQWDQIATQQDDGSDIGGGGRNSFDASSGGEFGFGEEDDSGVHSGYASGTSPSYSPGPHQAQMMGVGPPSNQWMQQPPQEWTGG
ncbi:hypothetical protein AJ80_00782 [Polytolypa hystricis UAMH7299]|uniref:C2H2-type domain-containing protein n=1 Tax=Polytolypa hystricis (strain UAMH7299) TaxID=1447883 RepID=A0A2B7Z2H0_POLH7|nr:hypothetical protein AJ80_00782 [Polytolypa hystricis UAMH7299]